MSEGSGWSVASRVLTRTQVCLVQIWRRLGVSLHRSRYLVACVEQIGMQEFAVPASKEVTNKTGDRRNR